MELKIIKSTLASAIGCKFDDYKALKSGIRAILKDFKGHTDIYNHKLLSGFNKVYISKPYGCVAMEILVNDSGNCIVDYVECMI